MSDIEHVKGRMVALCTQGLAEVCASSLLENKGVELSGYYTATEQLGEEFGSRYLIINDTVYEVLEKTEIDPYEDISNISTNEDGSVDFEAKWYNGGGSLEEVIKVAMDIMEKENTV